MHTSDVPAALLGKESTMYTAVNVQTGERQGLAFCLRTWSGEVAPLARILDISEAEARHVIALRLQMWREERKASR